MALKATASGKQGRNGSVVPILGAMILFFVVFDGMMTYLLPLIVTEHGLSKTMLGVVIGIAAISGAFFDFAIYRIFKDAFYRRLFIAMFAAGAVYLCLMWYAETLALYLVAMALWGFYFDLKSFGTMDFVSRHSEKKELQSSFGTLQAFQAAGYLLAPMIAGFLIIDVVGSEPFIAAGVFLCISAAFFALLILKVRGKKQHIPKEVAGRGTRNFGEEIDGWKKVGGALLPLLALATLATVADAFFISIGPLLGESLPIEPFDGILMAAYFMPPLITGALVGKLAQKFGEKKTGLLGLLCGSVALLAMPYLENPIAVVVLVFVASCFLSLMLPVVQGAYARCIRQAPKMKKEVQELGDFALNFGYVIGPVWAGMIADANGNAGAFFAFGIIGIFSALALFMLMPEKITVGKNKGR